jgi:hypothetical protein
VSIIDAGIALSGIEYLAATTFPLAKHQLVALIISSPED